ncbi:hypothetical protein ACFO0N_19650 [Halobium salinum]|uniref:Uncharacterized protein n=1 Tax=Halobium salinum TaxID=1364940 RepID=A0ABD5PH07_9EURY
MGTETVTCPLCEEYSGPARSVESHISGKADPVHKGVVGRQFRDQLEGVEATPEPTSKLREAPLEASGEGEEEESSDGGRETTVEEVDEPSSEPTEIEVVETVPPATGEGGVIPVGPMQAVAALGVGALGAFVVQQLRDSRSPSAEQSGPAFPNPGEADLV